MAESKWSYLDSDIEKAIQQLGTDELGYTNIAKTVYPQGSTEEIDALRTYIRRNFYDEVDNARSEFRVGRSEQEERPMSALREDGKVMSIEEYCEFYGIPFADVKSYKLITHTGVPLYNIQSGGVAGQGFEEFKKRLIDDIRTHSPKNLSSGIVTPNSSAENHLLVVDPADIHVGKLTSTFEVGEEYNADIAVQRVIEGVKGLLDKAKGFNIDQILFVAGNDVLHTDTPKRTTTSGTPQDTDGMWYENFLKAKDLYIECVALLLEVAPVHFCYNPSNHDYMSSFFLADVIKTYFENTPNVTFDTSIAHRKYFTYGNNLIGTTHGDGAKQNDLGPLMAHEAEDWSKCKHRYIYTHHVHHKNSKDHIGVTIESLRSPSATDSWHHRNGYTGVPKAVEAFLHSKEHGQIARFTHLF